MATAKHRTLRDVKSPAPASGNREGAKRPIYATDITLIRTANKWANAYLPGYSLPELEKALGLLLRHPEQASPGYSKAKEARQRVQLELNRRAATPSA